jgi:hypothetical protein
MLGGKNRVFISGEQNAGENNVKQQLSHSTVCVEVQVFWNDTKRLICMRDEELSGD